MNYGVDEKFSKVEEKVERIKGEVIEMGEVKKTYKRKHKKSFGLKKVKILTRK